MKTVYLVISLLFIRISFGQGISENISKAVGQLEKDPQFAHAIISMYVIDGKTGKVVYEKNSQAGLAPASCQKIITSAAAFELLGKDYRYKTLFGYNGNIADSFLNGNLYIIGNGDPTLGSWRWKETSEDFITRKIIDAVHKLGINSVKGFIIDNRNWGTQTLPGGWVWEDIGNYYGAGCSAFNWHENQYDIVLKPGKKIGDTATILSANPLGIVKTVCEVTTAEKGSGDQAYVYNAPYSMISFVRGTIPIGNDSFKISASSVDGVSLFQNKVILKMYQQHIPVFKTSTMLTNYLQDDQFEGKLEKKIFDISSPSLDSINYWFLKKSVNLYGEAFVKAIAFEKTGIGSTDSGVAVIRNFWNRNGIERSAINIIDGSGLSPANRVTTASLVRVLSYAKERSWFPSFYGAMPEMNGIKMKDGYIGGVRSYAGYIKSKGGIDYIFSFIVNNFDDSPGAAREKIWKVLDLLK